MFLQRALAAKHHWTLNVAQKDEERKNPARRILMISHFYGDLIFLSRYSRTEHPCHLFIINRNNLMHFKGFIHYLFFKKKKKSLMVNRCLNGWSDKEGVKLPPPMFSPSAPVPPVPSLLLLLSLLSCQHPTPPPHPPSHRYLSYFSCPPHTPPASTPRSCLFCLPHQPLLQPLHSSRVVHLQPACRCPAETPARRFRHVAALFYHCFAFQR